MGVSPVGSQSMGGVKSKASPRERFACPSYATLLQTGAVVSSADGGRVDVAQDLFRACIAIALGPIAVDEAWYLTRYPDVRAAIDRRQVGGAHDHFVRFGFFEHRWPRPIRVEEAWYLRTYPDVKRALDRRTFKSAQEHFDEFGYREGRLPYAGFSLIESDDDE
ncbi:MAG TPA: hypothetical protein VG248_01195 [Caulobacteraceae bacterium]|nr:hypothetical protein [Caulobacteraceae bacterium]